MLFLRHSVVVRYEGEEAEWLLHRCVGQFVGLSTPVQENKAT